MAQDGWPRLPRSLYVAAFSQLITNYWFIIHILAALQDQTRDKCKGGPRPGHSIEDGAHTDLPFTHVAMHNQTQGKCKNGHRPTRSLKTVYCSRTEKHHCDS